MTANKLDCTPLTKALSRLETAIARSQKSPDDEELRDACIQRFEYSFELAWKLLKRQLEIEIANTVEVDSFSKKQLFRVAGEKGLISNVESWFDYLAKRNLTSHTYAEEVATSVAQIVADFYRDAVALRDKLVSRHD